MAVRPRVPGIRIHHKNSAPVRGDASYVLYWMIAARRAHWNFALDRALELAREFGKPLLVLEPLRCGHRWASDRIHRFVIDGMRDNAAAFEAAGVTYYPYVEPAADAGKGLLEAFASHACAVVTDEFPCFFLPRMVEKAASVVPVRLEAVDSNGLLPLRATDRVFDRAVDFRRFLQRELPSHWAAAPRSQPLRGARRPAAAVSANIRRLWPRANLAALTKPGDLAKLPIDHSVPPVPLAGGSRAGERALQEFVKRRLAAYGEPRGDLDRDKTSGLSPYLHFGHVSAHRVFDRIAAQEEWSPPHAPKRATGKREGWWGMRPAVESFLDELVTWRELGYHDAARRGSNDQFASLPGWARATLAAHRRDPRPWVYSLEQFEAADTHDELWNAAQRQLRGEGVVQSYLRMLWGKKILHWSGSPEAALEIMIELNNKYAIDGRDPNSSSGIFWTLGRFDRPWPARDVFGTVRYMTSESTRRKFQVDGYMKRWGRR